MKFTSEDLGEREAQWVTFSAADAVRYHLAGRQGDLQRLPPFTMLIQPYDEADFIELRKSCAPASQQVSGLAVAHQGELAKALAENVILNWKEMYALRFLYHVNVKPNIRDRQLAGRDPATVLMDFDRDMCTAFLKSDLAFMNWVSDKAQELSRMQSLEELIQAGKSPVPSSTDTDT